MILGLENFGEGFQIFTTFCPLTEFRKIKTSLRKKKTTNATVFTFYQKVGIHERSPDLTKPKSGHIRVYCISV